MFDRNLTNKVPQVYQIECCSHCNLKCPTCLRTTDMVRPSDLLDLKLLELMYERGDFAATKYIELQLAGEPTLHPKLGGIIDYLHSCGLMVGLSTHGLQMKNPDVLEALLQLDALTISVDSVDRDLYHKMRYPATLDKLMECLHTFFNALKGYIVSSDEKGPYVELQLIRIAEFEGSGDEEALNHIMEEAGWNFYADVRVIDDCFGGMQGRKDIVPDTTLCLNPFSSVSVLVNGDVVSCCYVFEPKKDEVNYYGNLYEKSLAEIWAGERVEEMQECHKEGRQKDECAKCYLRSPVLNHIGIISGIAQSRR